MQNNINKLRKKSLKSALRLKRKIKVRKKISGSAERPRLTVFKSLNHMYVQAVDDVSGKTLACASTKEKGFSAEGAKVEAASKVGLLVGERLKDQKVTQVVFDRNGFKTRNHP